MADTGTVDGNSSKAQSPPIDSQSPFYLHPSHHPGLPICPVILKGDNYQEWSTAMRNALQAKRKMRFLDNYQEWSTAMRNALQAKRKMGFLDGRITQPADDSSLIDDWWSVNSMLIGWITQSMDPAVRSSISYPGVSLSVMDLESFRSGRRLHSVVKMVRPYLHIMENYGSFGRN
ncbi:unnamed protein product [Rhodiola kirilowii]